MKFRELIKESCKIYFIIATLICLAIFLLGSIFEPDAQFGYEAFLSPLIYAFFGVIPVAVMYSQKEFSVKQLVIRKIIQWISIEAIVFVICFQSSAITKSGPLLIGLFLAVLIIYVLSIVIEFLLDSRQAAEMNKALKDYQSEE